MPKRRREQQHLRQEAARRKASPQATTAHYARPKPGFPMNLLTDIRWFSIVGLVAVVAMIFTAILFQAGGGPSASDVPETPTPTVTPTPDPNATPTPSPEPTKAPLRFTAAEQVVDAATKTYKATIKTDKGEVVITLYADKAPNTVNSFVFLAQRGFFDGIKFHRVVADFVVQTGDPTGTGSGGPGYETEQEKTDLTNKRGFVSMARAAGSTKFGSQFFINLKDNPALDTDAPNQARFYPFGEVTSGMDVVARIAQGDVIRSLTITEAPK